MYVGWRRMTVESKGEKAGGGAGRKTTYTSAQSTSLNMSTQFYARKN